MFEHFDTKSSAQNPSESNPLWAGAYQDFLIQHPIGEDRRDVSDRRDPPPESFDRLRGVLRDVLGTGRYYLLGDELRGFLDRGSDINAFRRALERAGAGQPDLGEFRSLPNDCLTFVHRGRHITLSAHSRWYVSEPSDYQRPGER